MKISMPRKLRQTVLPLLAALIWGTAFVMQKGNTAGALILHERLSLREYFGCGLMFAAVLISQLPDRKKEKQRHLKIDG